MKNKKFVSAVMIPALLHMTIFIIAPIIIGLFISFWNYNPLSSDNYFVGLDNFIKLMSDADFWKATKNTFFFVFVTVFINIALSLVIAQMISYFKSNKVRSFFRMLFFLPCIAPMVASAVVFNRSILPTTTGLLNMFLKWLGFAPVNWLGDSNVIMISLIVYTIWVDIGYNIILFSAGIDGIQNHIYEAADLDNTNEWRKFTKMTLPLLSRTMQFVVVQTLISHLQMCAKFTVLI